MSKNSILIDSLPTEILGKKINADYKSILRFFEIQESQDDDEIKGNKITAVLFPDGAPDDDSLGEEFRKFLTMGETDHGDTGEKCFDFRVDASRIYASFFQAYKIDLTKENPHWWSFISLFNALPDDTIIKKIIDIRTRKIDAKMAPKDRTELMRLKDRYSLSKDTDADDYGLGCLFRRK